MTRLATLETREATRCTFFWTRTRQRKSGSRLLWLGLGRIGVLAFFVLPIVSLRLWASRSRTPKPLLLSLYGNFYMCRRLHKTVIFLNHIFDKLEHNFVFNFFSNSMQWHSSVATNSGANLDKLEKTAQTWPRACRVV